MNWLKVFETELGYIKDEKIRKFTEKIINILPEYFFEIPASSTGKYHPSYALGDGGLVRHTKAAVRIAVELFSIESYELTEEQKDYIIASLILHDGCKSGLTYNKYTVTEHPLIVAKLIRDNADNSINTEIIATNIESHMGGWCFDYKTKKQILPKPNTKIQHFVHLCDYLASRKCLEFDFETLVERK